MASTYVFRIKRGDTLPALLLAIKDRNGAAVDLSDCESATLRIGIAGTVLERAATIKDPQTDGRVSYDFLAEDWEDIPRGRFVAEVRLTFTGGSVLTAPTTGGFIVDVEAPATP